MTTSRADVLLHPIRMRIILTILGREMTPQQIAKALPDVPQTTLYRHINRLHAAGALSIVAENPIRGTVEKVYAISPEAVSLKESELASLSREEHLRYFSAFLAGLLEHFRAYLQQEPFNLITDGVSYRSAPLYLTDEEFQQLIEALRAVLRPALSMPPAPGRRRRLYTTIILPDRMEQEDDAVENASE